MKSISVGQLRQNPTHMLEEVASGETYAVTKHQREVAHVVPPIPVSVVVPPRKAGGACTVDLERVEVPGGVDALLDELRGEW